MSERSVYVLNIISPCCHNTPQHYVRENEVSFSRNLQYSGFFKTTTRAGYGNFGQLRQEDNHEFEARLGYTVIRPVLYSKIRPCLKKRKRKSKLDQIFLLPHLMIECLSNIQTYIVYAHASVCDKSLNTDQDMGVCPRGQQERDFRMPLSHTESWAAPLTCDTAAWPPLPQLPHPAGMRWLCPCL